MRTRASAIVLALILTGMLLIAIYLTQPKPIHDKTPPVITITTPIDGATLSGLTTVSFSATDDNTIVTYEIRIDDIIRANTSTYEWNTTLELDGEHIVLCRAQDDSGNWGESSISVTIENNESPQPAPANEYIFKIMTYNIEESGVNPDWKKVVKEENPDILILIETGTWDDNSSEVLTKVVNEFNEYFSDEQPYVGYCAQGISFDTDGEAILSRFPVVAFNQISTVELDNGSSYDVTHDFIEAVVTIGDDNVHIFGAHLKSSSGAENEWRRELETEGIINYMDSLGDVPIIYMGDLNSFSPDDTGNLAPSGDLGYGPLTMMLHSEDSTYGKHSSTVHSFIDIFRTLNPSEPGYTYGHQNPSYKSRIDYILANSFFLKKLINSTTGDTPSADTGSDHYSVDVFINWNSTIEPDSTPPSKVIGINATAVSTSQIDLVWSANTEPDLLYYRVYRNGSLLTATSNTSYSDTGLIDATTYFYEVSAVDTSLNEGPPSDPVNATTYRSGDPDLVVINEFLPDPDVSYTEEWIELYNPQPLATDLTGYYLDDVLNSGSSPYQIPSGTVIDAYGFLVFYQNETGVNLNNAGDDVNLLKPDGLTVIDSCSYNSSSNDVSIGRASDGNGTWISFSNPTPGASNNITSNDADLIVINEFLPSPNTEYSVEWIELYNPLNISVDISGYYLDDNITGGSSPYRIPIGTVIPAHGFLVFNQSATGVILNDAGDSINYIKDNGIDVLDSYTYSSLGDDISIGRTVDGGSQWTTFTSPTPGRSNNGSNSNAEYIVLNEFLPDPNTLFSEEWIELYNPLNINVDVSGFIIDDIISGGSSPFTIPDGTIIPARSFIVFTQSTTGIYLNNAGDTVNYIASDGITIIDSHSYPSSSNDVSIGRITDGNSTWTTFNNPTPGSSNNSSALFSLSLALWTDKTINLVNNNHILSVNMKPNIYKRILCPTK